MFAVARSAAVRAFRQTRGTFRRPLAQTRPQVLQLHTTTDLHSIGAGMGEGAGKSGEGKSVAIVLSGCGVYDGSEITEAVATIVHLSTAGASYQCFAPNKDQMHAVNHLTGEAHETTRNVLEESARIARGNVKDLAELSASDFDAVVFPYVASSSFHFAFGLLLVVFNSRCATDRESTITRARRCVRACSQRRLRRGQEPLFMGG